MSKHHKAHPIIQLDNKTKLWVWHFIQKNLCSRALLHTCLYHCLISSFLQRCCPVIAKAARAGNYLSILRLLLWPNGPTEAYWGILSQVSVQLHQLLCPRDVSTSTRSCRNTSLNLAWDNLQAETLLKRHPVSLVKLGNSPWIGWLCILEWICIITMTPM